MKDRIFFVILCLRLMKIYYTVVSLYHYLNHIYGHFSGCSYGLHKLSFKNRRMPEENARCHKCFPSYQTS